MSASPKKGMNNNPYSDRFMTSTDPNWMKDDDTDTCLHCEVKFSVLKHRHHCRLCGGVFCSTCSPVRAELQERACTPCYDTRDHVPEPLFEMPNEDDRAGIEASFEAFMTKSGFKEAVKENMRKMGSGQKYLLLQQESVVKRPVVTHDSGLRWATKLKNPSIKVEQYQRLRVLLASNSTDWIDEFINYGGLYNLVQKMPKSPQYLVLPGQIEACAEVLRCLKAIMNTEFGLSAVVPHLFPPKTNFLKKKHPKTCTSTR